MWWVVCVSTLYCVSAIYTEQNVANAANKSEAYLWIYSTLQYNIFENEIGSPTTMKANDWISHVCQKNIINNYNNEKP